MRSWLLVLILTDPAQMPVVHPVESLAACRERAPVEAFHLEMTNRPVAMVQCHPAPRLRSGAGDIVTR